MKGILLLAIVLGAVLGLFGIVVNAPPEQSKIAGAMSIVALIALGVGLRGPLGRAIATLVGAGDDSRAGEERARLAAQLDELMEELRSTRDEVGELQERVDFAERLLAAPERRTVPLSDRAAGDEIR
ncbi:MAG TPA: hypothetical protein VGA42_04605 [Gemmatimonadales bacterium]